MDSLSTPVAGKSGAQAIDSPITWRFLIIIGLAWAAEYAVLRLIEDANLALKVATILCALAGIFVLEIQRWVVGGRYSFAAGIIIVTIVYLGFVGYSIIYAYDRYAVSQRLEENYMRGADIRQAPFKGDVNVQNWTKQYLTWRDETSSYLKENVGAMASEKFLIAGKGTSQYSKDEVLNYGLNQMSDMLANLESIMTSKRQ